MSAIDEIPSPHDICPECGRPRWVGHAPECALNAALAAKGE